VVALADFVDPHAVGLSLSATQVDALFFLLGSFVVASLSDLRHLSAQREFAEVWGAMIVVLLGIDLWQHTFELDTAFFFRWALVFFLALFSFGRTGLLFKLAAADVLAVCAAASLLSPVLIVVFAIVLKIVSLPASRALAKKGGVYPFLPVVTIATLLVLALGVWLGG
jgi:hypothetical protein